MHMAARHRPRAWIGRAAVLAVAILLWQVSTTQSGYSYAELVVFAGPAMVLAIAGNWASAAFRHDGWNWTRALRAAVLGAILLPPMLAAAIALFSAWNGSAVLLTFILGAWLALGTGVFIASVRALFGDFKRARSGEPEPDPGAARLRRRRTSLSARLFRDGQVRRSGGLRALSRVGSDIKLRRFQRRRRVDTFP